MRASLATFCLVLAAGCSGSAGRQDFAAADREKAPVKEADAPADEPTTRRVIQTADLDLLVDDLDFARRELLQLVERCKGFVAASEAHGSAGSPRSGRCTVRIPVAGYDRFLDEAGRLGEPLHVRTNAQDVTEQFVDLDARLKNKRVEEARLQEHLKSSTGKLDEILTVERELARVRGEIEQAQGRLQKLGGLADLATATVSLTERRGYLAPQPPAFSTTIAGTFAGSLDVLLRAGKLVVLAVVALAPWLPVLGVIAVGGWLVARRQKAAAVRPTGPAGP